MENLPPEMKMIASLQGDVLAIQAFMSALVATLSPAQRQAFAANFEESVEFARTAILPTSMPEESVRSFEMLVNAIRPTSARPAPR